MNTENQPELMKAKLIDPDKLQWDAERKVFTYPLDAVIGEVPWTPAPASVAPQEEWTVAKFRDGAGQPCYLIELGRGTSRVTLGRAYSQEDADSFVSRLREDKKEIERLRGEIEEWRKRCERFRNL